MIRNLKWINFLVIILFFMVTDLILCNEEYFIQIDTNAVAIVSTLKMDFSKPNVESCLKFKYHMKGTSLKDLTFGYYESSKYTDVNTVPRKNEDFWFCATFDLSLMSSQAQGIFFRAESGGVFSVIALDFITLIEGGGCKNLGECPVPKTTPAPATTKNPPTVATTGESASLSNETWYIVGGACGGVVLLAVIIVILCIVKRRRSKRDIPSLPSASFLNNPNSRQLPAIPCDQNISNGSIMSIAESYDPIMSKNGEVWKNEHVQTQPTYPIVLKNDEAWENEHLPTETDNNRVASTDYTDILETSPVRENKSDLSDYIHVPPDYPNDDETSQKDYLVPEEEKQSNEEDENTKIEHNEIKNEHIYINEPDDDYLEPINALGESIRAPDNQYESDPTDKGSKGKTSPVNLCVAPFTEEHLEIPQIPVMHRERYQLTAEDKDNDYDDAATALNGYTTENSDQDELYDNSKGGQDTHSIKSDKEDYFDMTENRKDKDCVKLTKDSYDNSKGGQDNNSVKSDKEDYLYMTENRKDEDCVKPTKDVYDSSGGVHDNNSVNSDKEDYFDMSENQHDEDYVKPTIDTS
ncbi:uncharacterized protein [Mytilus edulis]|uniref:uncharacterized protein isoform X2 n=1 Tax=Mytilus edulis TaxID=6550 RepID=UPI0039F05A48